MRREMSVVGSFYPARDVEIERYFEHFNTILAEEQIALPALSPKAVIVPHAGYIYSGLSANAAYRVLTQSGLKNLLILGPSHRVALEGASLCEAQNYETPFGDIAYAKELHEALSERFGLRRTIIHAEHSTEVQFPFIKHYMPHAKITEIIYGRVQPSYLSEIIDFALAQENTGVIISTDLSHFYTQEEANKLDGICLHAIESLDISLLHRGCEACGILGVEAMLMSAKKNSLKPHLLDYRTSADAGGDTSRVVGYVSACFSQANA